METFDGAPAPDTLRRKVRDNPQDALFNIGEKWQDTWWGMPSYVMGDARPSYRITVNIFTLDDLIDFGQKIGQRVTAKTDSLCYPVQSLDKPSEWIYSDEA